MKTLITIALTVVIPIVINAQSRPYLSAGSTYSIIEDQKATVLNNAGYYTGIGLTEKIRKWTVNTELQFLRQNFKNDRITAKANSGNIFLYTGYQPFKLPVSIYLGTQMGFVFNSEFKGDIILQEKGPRYSIIGGVGYKIRRFEVIGKYYRTMDGPDPMDYTLQLGLNFKIKAN